VCVCVCVCVCACVCSLRAQLTEARSLVSRLSSDNERLMHERRPGAFSHDKQLEDLRLLQVSVNHRYRYDLLHTNKDICGVNRRVVNRSPEQNEEALSD
jgi:hypothetical protein